MKKPQSQAQIKRNWKWYKAMARASVEATHTPFAIAKRSAVLRAKKRPVTLAKAGRMAGINEL